MKYPPCFPDIGNKGGVFHRNRTDLQNTELGDYSTFLNTAADREELIKVSFIVDLGDKNNKEIIQGILQRNRSDSFSEKPDDGLVPLNTFILPKREYKPELAEDWETPNPIRKSTKCETRKLKPPYRIMFTRYCKRRTVTFLIRISCKMLTYF